MLKASIYVGIAICLWVGSVVAWGVESSASFDWGALGPNPSNAEIYPIENQKLLGFGLGMLTSLAALIFAYVGGFRMANRASK